MKLKTDLHTVTAFAPATSANVVVGFDSLGFAVQGIGDTVKLTKRKDSKVVIESIKAKEALPFDLEKNTAAVAVTALCKKLKLEQGFSIYIEKGIPLSSGLGGSAASAVAALVACNRFLLKPLSPHELAEFALLGEVAACGQAHADNIIPCLFGGLTLIQSREAMQVIALPIPKLYCVLLHPHLKITTREARACLSENIALKDHVKQSANMAGLIAALYQKNMTLLAQCLEDCIIEKQRASLIPNFYKLKEEALRLGALTLSFSGSGPTLFAFSNTKKEAKTIALALQQMFVKQGINADFWINPMRKQAAEVIEENNDAIL